MDTERIVREVTAEMTEHWIVSRIAASEGIQPVDVYDAFALSLFVTERGVDILEEDEAYAQFEATRLRDKFIAPFMPLLRKQIEKYLNRSDRYDHEQTDWLETAHSAPASELAEMFDTATFRSERHRSVAPEEVYNIKWAAVARAVAKLEQSSGVKDVAIALAGQAGLLNLIHNTGTLVLDKFSGWRGLKMALDVSHAGTPEDIYAGANPDVKRLLRHSLPRADLLGV